MNQHARSRVVAYATYEDQVLPIYYSGASVHCTNGDGQPTSVSLIIDDSYPWLSFIVEEIVSLTGCIPLSLHDADNLYPEYLV